jgi:hypothetical protein
MLSQLYLPSWIPGTSLKVHHAESLNENDAFFMTQFCEDGDLDDALEKCKFGTNRSDRRYSEIEQREEQNSGMANRRPSSAASEE